MTTQFHSRLNYPDPFKPTGIEFVLPEEAVISIAIYNEQGNIVSTIVDNQPYQSGAHKIIANMEAFSKGNYFYRITAEGKHRRYSETKRVV